MPVRPSFLYCLGTVLFTRLTLGLLAVVIPQNTAWIYQDSFHHYYGGVVLLVLSQLPHKQWAKNVLSGIGWGLILDEVMLPLFLLGTWNYGYWSWQNIIPTILALIGYALLARTKTKQK